MVQILKYSHRKHAASIRDDEIKWAPDTTNSVLPVAGGEEDVDKSGLGSLSLSQSSYLARRICKQEPCWAGFPGWGSCELCQHFLECVSVAGSLWDQHGTSVFPKRAGMTRGTVQLQKLKYLLSSPFCKKFADLCFKSMPKIGNTVQLLEQNIFYNICKANEKTVNSTLFFLQVNDVCNKCQLST